MRLKWLYAILRFIESCKPVESVPLTKERKRCLYQIEGRREQ
jgi:hypothetical protein